MESKVTFGSVCDGIGCGHLAFNREGYDCQWSAEIEPFPSAVLAHRFPDVRNIGNMMLARELIEKKEINAPDVFIGGTPCQAFSIAGKREGLNDARGNLSLEFCRIADGIDAVRLAAGKDGCVVCWENVPGVLSDKGNAFGCFLGMLSGEDEAIEVEKWPTAGMVCGTRRRVAWCVLDSQYFGVAQRRRRVFVVAVPNQLIERIGARADPAEILSIGTSLRRDTPTRQDARKGVAGDAGKRVEGSHWDGSGVHPTINQSAKGSGGIGASNQEIFSQRGGGLVHCADVTIVDAKNMYDRGDSSHNDRLIVEDVAHCLQTTCNDYSRADGFNMIVEPSQAIYENHAQDCRVTGPHDVSPMLSAKMGTGGGNVPLVGPGAVGVGIGGSDVAFSLRATPSHSGDKGDGGVNCTMVVEPCIAISDVIHGDKACNGKGWNDDGSAYTLDTMATHGVCVGIDEEQNAHVELMGCLKARTLGGGFEGSVMTPTSTVRRITVTECERLQGLPDGWTAIPWRSKPASECPDGPRYKGIGNGQTVQVMQWLAMRIRNAITDNGKDGEG